MRKLEDYINNNRDLFDNEQPPVEIKNFILKTINTDKTSEKRNKSNWYLVAASLVLIVGMTMLFSKDYISNIQKEYVISESLPEYKEAEDYYKTKIQLAKKELKQTVKNEEIEVDFDIIDNMILELKEELVSAPKNRKKRIVKKIFDGYKTEIKLLKRITRRSKNLS